MKKYRHLFIFLFLIVSCSKSDDSSETENTLYAYILNKTVEEGAVIACAGTEADTNNILVFYYPEEGASNVKLFVTQDISTDKNDYANYVFLPSNSLSLFNGYLEKRPLSLEIEKWVIVTFELDDEVKISNPIRLKQISKQTVWTENVTIDQSVSEMPSFMWADNALGDNAIYFQVVSDNLDNLLSGTYTYENQFTYYNTTNVVLNITQQFPPTLNSGNIYNFTLMDVSEDNWVNLVIQKSFIAE